MSLTLYSVEQGKLVSSAVDPSVPIGDRAIWCDLCSPSKEEESLVESWLGIEIPTRDEMQEIETSSRFYSEDGALYASGVIITKSDTVEPESHVITFILYQNRLITVRYSDPYSFRVIMTRKDEDALPIVSGYSILLNLLGIVIARVADILENAGRGLANINHLLFRPTVIDKDKRLQAKPNFEDILRQTGVYGDLFSKTQESLWSLSRLIGFVMQAANPKLEETEQERANVLLRDMAALSDHVKFLSNKINFLLDATLGMIGIDQSGIIKIFSVAAVVFLPPTLVASIYGMNFHFMPELDWHLGYPLAIGIMALSALLPYLFFKKKKWL